MKNALVGCFLFGVLMTALQYQNIGVVVVVAAVWTFVIFGRRVTSASGYMTLRGHSHNGAYSDVCLHEGAHAAAAEQEGGKVLSAWVEGDENSARGQTWVRIPNDPASQIGVHLAGLYAAPGTTSPSDLAKVDEVLSTVPSPYRSSVRQAGESIARRAARSSTTRYYAKRLEPHGRL